MFLMEDWKLKNKINKKIGTACNAGDGNYVIV